MINRGGEKIYSLELENILYLWGVREVAVIPTPARSMAKSRWRLSCRTASTT
ncbi:MAG: hypothetical protein ACLR17_00815 [Enterobacteriaceae bacterium]